MGVSDWEKKRTLDAMLKGVPTQARNEYVKRMEAEKDRDGEKKKDISVEAPPFLKSKKTATNQAKPVKDESEGQLGMVTPRPLMINRVPGIEPRPNLGFSQKSSPGTNDGHTHTAYYDEAGNGYTSEDEGHTHTVRSFMLDYFQTPHGMQHHTHPGELTKQNRTPGAVMGDFTGVVK